VNGGSAEVVLQTVTQLIEAFQGNVSR
jgi:hypothetical protein